MEWFITYILVGLCAAILNTAIHAFSKKSTDAPMIISLLASVVVILLWPAWLFVLLVGGSIGLIFWSARKPQ